ncbi:hypothetical protein ACSQ67_012487 [Phaseolus vulgaris]
MLIFYVGVQLKVYMQLEYVRLVISRLHTSPEEIKQHPRLYELKKIHGIEDERPSIGTTVQQTISSGLLSITLNCVGASMGEKPPLTKKLPATTTVKHQYYSSNAMFSISRPKNSSDYLVFLRSGSPFPLLLDNDTSSLMDLGIGNDSIILVDQERS